MKRINNLRTVYFVIYFISYIFSCMVFVFFYKESLHFFDILNYAIIFGLFESFFVLIEKRIIPSLILFILNSFVSNFIILIYENHKNFKLPKLMLFSIKHAFSTLEISIILSLGFSVFSFICIFIYNVLHRMKNNGENKND